MIEVRDGIPWMWLCASDCDGIASHVVGMHANVRGHFEDVAAVISGNQRDKDNQGFEVL